MKKIAPLILITTLAYSAQTDLQNRVDTLENELKSLKSEIKYHNEELDLRMPIIEQSERKTILDKIDFSPEIELRVDQFDYQLSGLDDATKIYGGDYNGQLRRTDFSKHFDPSTSIKFRLNMHTQLDENVEFHGNLLFATSSQSYQRLCILSRDIKSVSATSAFDVERAYFNYSTNKNAENSFTFTFGILPTTGGTPMNYAQNKKRASMFPALVFDMNTYGVIATQKFSDDFYLRAVVAKAYTLRSTFYPYQCNRENIDNASVFALFSDLKFNFLGDGLLTFGVNMLHDFKAHPYLGPDVDSSTAKVLGDIFTFGLGANIEKVADSDLTIFVHTALSNPHANGESEDYKIVATAAQTLADGLTESGSTGFTVEDYASGTMLKQNGYSIYIGGKYDISKAFAAGAEYNYGSKYWFSATQGAEDMYNKLATRGHVGEIYGMWKFHKNIHSKLSYMYSKEEYTGSGWHFGEPAHKDGQQNVVSLSISARY